jgi:hypothetical protein
VAGIDGHAISVVSIPSRHGPSPVSDTSALDYVGASLGIAWSSAQFTPRQSACTPQHPSCQRGFFGDKAAFCLDVYFKTMNDSKPVQRFFNFTDLRKT